MVVRPGELFIPTEEEKAVTLQTARRISIALDVGKPVSFQIGVNALAMVLASAISAEPLSNEKKIMLAKAVGDAVTANLILSGVVESIN